MTIETDYSPAVYQVSGLTYQFNWQVIDPDHIVVEIDDNVVSPGLYAVVLSGVGPIFDSGYIQFLSQPAGQQLTISRVTPATQSILYSRYTAFPAKDNEFGLDKLTMLTQERGQSTGGGGNPPSGNFLPLTGGTMSAGANINWQAPGLSSIGVMTFQGFLGVGAFQWGPASGSDPIGFLWSPGGGPIMGYDVQGVLALEGRPDFATLPDNAVALKADVLTGGGQFVPLSGGTWDEGALMVYPKNPAAPDTSDAEFGFVNFFGINGLRVQAVTPNTPLGIGYLFLTDQQGVETPFVVGSKSDGWRVRFQNFDDADAIVTRDYLETNTIEEAPIDGEPYARQDEAWVTLTTALDFLPLAGGTMDPDARISYSSTVNAAPVGGVFSFENLLNAGTFYIRPEAGLSNDIGYLFLTSLTAGNPALGANSNDGFEIVNQQFTSPNAILTLGEAESRFLVDAPIDGNEYVRFNGGWAVSTGGSGGEVNTNSNAGAGAGLVLPKVGADTPIKSLVAGTNITITEQANTVTIAASGTVSVNWGGIGGTLSAQTDLQNALNAKANLTGGNAFTGNQTIDGQLVVGGGLTGGVQITGSGADVGLDVSAQIIARGGTGNIAMNAVDNRIVRLAAGTDGLDAINLNQLNSGLAGKANTNHTHSISQVTGLQAALDGKAALSHTHTIAQVTGLQTALNAKAERNANETISGIWTFSSGFSASFGVNLNGGAIMGNTRIQGLANGTNTTDAINLGQLNSGLAGKANTSHTHTIAQVSGLQAALDGKANLAGGNTFTGNQTINAQLVVGGGLAGGVQITGSGADIGLDVFAQIIARGGTAGIAMNAVDNRITRVGPATDGLDAVNLNQLNSGLAGKANSNHIHAISDVSGLQSSLDGKASKADANTFTAFNQFNGNVTFGGSVNFFTNGANMNNSRVVNVGNAVSGADAVNRNFLLTTNHVFTGIPTFSAGFNASVGVVLNGGALMGTSRIQGLGDPVNPQDAATRAWVEANFAPL